MKTPHFILIVFLSLLAGSHAFGDCGSTCNDLSDCQQSTCVKPQNYCQCSDVNSGKNPCITKSDYCRDFGNVGENKLTE